MEQLIVRIAFVLCFVFGSSAVSIAGNWFGNNSTAGTSDCTSLSLVPFGEGAGAAAAMHSCLFTEPLKVCKMLAGNLNLHWCFHVPDWGGASARYVCDANNARTSTGKCTNAPKSNSNKCGGSTGNPIELISGRKHQNFEDWSAGSSGQLKFERYYSSFFDLFSDVAPFATNSSLGKGWRSNFDSSASFDLKSGANSPATAATNDLVHFVLPDHSQYSFKKLSGGGWTMVHVTASTTPGVNSWVNRSDYDGTLTALTDKVMFRSSDGTVYAYDNSGLLQSIETSTGYRQNIYYSAGLIHSVTDSYGMTLRFEHETDVMKPRLLKRVLLPEGKDLRFTYESRLLINGAPATTLKHDEYALDRVTYPDDTSGDPNDNPFVDYSYLSSNLYPYSLTSIRDERGVLHGEWTYDNKGRAISSQHEGGADATTLAFDDVGNKVTVTNALGKQTVYQMADVNGHERRTVQVDGIASSNCLASNTTNSFNASGFLTQQSDAEGRLTTWTRDARGMPLSRVDGSGSPSARTTLMSWHPQLPQPSQVEVPGLTTTYAYDASNAGLVTSFTETDTTTTSVPFATAGQTRTTSFSYVDFTPASAPVISPPSSPLANVPLAVVNHNAETGPVSGALTGWTAEQGSLAILATGQCSSTNKCFWGNLSNPIKAYQDVAIPSTYHGEVDGGLRVARATWKQGGKFGDVDSADVQMEFRDAAGTVILAKRGAGHLGHERWGLRSYAVPVPTGARTIRLRMTLERTGKNSYNDAYVDDIGLSLEASGSATATPFLPIANPDAINALSGWTVSAGSFSVATTGVCKFLNCFKGTSANLDSMYQDVVLPFNRLAEIDSSARALVLAWSENSTNNIVQATLRFYDSSDTELPGTSSTVAGTTTEDKWRRVESYALVPANARKVRMVFDMVSGWSNTSQGVMFTNVTLQMVGRPAAPSPMKLLASVDGPLAGTDDTVSYAYTASGLISTITNEVGHVTQVLTHTPAGLPATIVDANSVNTTLAYNARNWLTTVTVNPGAAQAVTTVEYDAIGQVTKITQPDGAFLQYTYNGARRLTSVKNNLNEIVEYTHNLNGDVTSSTVKTVAGGTIIRQMTMAYDELGRLLKSIGAAAQETTFSYDRTNLNTQVKDPRNNLYGYAYDSLQRLIRTTDQEGSQVNLTLNGQDALTAYQDPRNFTTAYVRNGFGEVIQESSPDAGTTVFVRDARGLVTQQTDGRGVVTNRTYDAAGRLKTETYPGAAAENVTYSYDAIAGGNKGRGRLTSITDQSGTTSFVYDALGRVITNTRVIAGKSYVTSYAYNTAGRVSTITYPSGRQLVITRNSVGRVTLVQTRVTSTAALSNVASAISFQPMSNQLKAMTHGNGLITTAAYDLDGRLTQLQVKNGALLVQGQAYAYADGMNLTGITDQVLATNSNTLGYSAANRLTSAIGPWGTKTHYYDGVGNRISDDTTLGTTSTNRIQYYANSSNRLNDIWQNGALLRAYGYDGAGNTISETRAGESFAYSYNKRNRLSSVTRNSVLWGTYVYNALEQLVSRTSNAPAAPLGTIHYVYDLDGHLIAEADGATGATLREYLWLPANDNTSGSGNDTLAEDFGLADNDNQAVDLPLAVIDGVNTATKTTSYIHTDHLGRPTRMTSATKATVWSASWTPWGEPQAISGTVTQNLRFPGQYFQIETGLAYNWHRNYDPVTGRYTQPDPLRFVDGPSVYAYAGNSPFVNTDREGLDSITGFTKHGINQAINRGVCPIDILDAIRNPLKIRPRDNGTTQYIGSGAGVVLNGSGCVVTCWSR